MWSLGKKGPHRLCESTVCHFLLHTPVTCCAHPSTAPTTRLHSPTAHCPHHPLLPLVTAPPPPRPLATSTAKQRKAVCFELTSLIQHWVPAVRILSKSLKIRTLNSGNFMWKKPQINLHMLWIFLNSTVYKIGWTILSLLNASIKGWATTYSISMCLKMWEPQGSIEADRQERGRQWDGREGRQREAGISTQCGRKTRKKCGEPRKSSETEFC